ncbi:MerR family transcriptional regulator [Neobacillus dielmonensis]|uniref:MerR family transcriptional regulator n=1 Tax=Neobacillus dielmonensis TaxID=1347369 RepID=UPI00069465D2|nr:MerR family transcriptional regulator [Neobacillus dielmonensis]
MKSYTLKEAAKKINVTPGTIRQWEKDLTGLLEIPRSKQGARIYTVTEINQMKEIKQLYAQKLSKEQIRQILNGSQEIEITNDKQEKEEMRVEYTPPDEISLEVIPEPEPQAMEFTASNTSLFFEAMDTYSKNFLNEVKEEIRTTVRKEVIDEVKKEISKGTLLTVKSISDSVYKSNANTQEEIKELSHSINKASEVTADRIQYLSKSIQNVSIETYEEITNLSKQLDDTTEEITRYFDHTNNEIYQLAENLAQDRDFLMEDREQFRRDIRQREAAFQQMLTNFREVAAAKEKKWWRFWD